MSGKVLQLVRVFRLPVGWLSVVGVAFIVAAGFRVSSEVGYTLAGIGCIAIDAMRSGGDRANPGGRIPQ